MQKRRMLQMLPQSERDSFAKDLYVVNLCPARAEAENLNMENLAAHSVQVGQRAAVLPATHNRAAAAKLGSKAFQNLEHTLYLRRGARALLRTNLPTSWGLVAGAIGEVVDFMFSPEYCEGRLPVTLVYSPRATCATFWPRGGKKGAIVPITPVSREWGGRGRGTHPYPAPADVSLCDDGP